MRKEVLTFLLILMSAYVFSQTRISIDNLRPRLDNHGEVIDAHDGRIIKFGNKFYWYGTAYGNTSGFLRSNFFQCFSSTDLMNWTKEGVLLENPPSGMYYRPHVIYNRKTRKYVLWYNWYPRLWDGKFGVAVSDKPTGPFRIVNRDVKVLNSRFKVGDFGLFVDDDNTAYIAYNTIDGHKGSVEKLSDDYRSSTLENGGFITEGCEAGAIFKRDNKYYLLTDFTCCFCSQGTGVNVYVSDNPMKGYQLRNNINRYPGVAATPLVDGVIAPNQYATLSRQEDGRFSSIQLDLPQDASVRQLKIYQFTGNHDVVDCGDTTAATPKYHHVVPEFEISVRRGNAWSGLPFETKVEKTSVYNIITLTLDAGPVSMVRLRPLPGYTHDHIFINEIEMYEAGQSASPGVRAAAYLVNDKSPGPPIIPAQQTFVLPLRTSKGTQYIWMGDLWGSASDNIKGHDYQYWGSPLVFDVNGNIEAMKWVDKWEAVIED